jgi:serine/threonine protein kinase
MVAQRPQDADPSASNTADQRVGRTLGGRWKLGAVLGTGGSARVYSARHRNGRSAAVKVLHEDLARHPRVVRRFISEGYAANKVGHPGAVTVLDDGEEPDGTMFLVMELLHGESLAQRLERSGPLPLEEVVSVAIGTLDVLAAAHDAGIIHRDVKPSNIFLTEGGEIKVLDFGAARVRESVDFVTQSGTTLGTPAFMAPELAAGLVEDVDARTDIWAVGACMFQLSTGTLVHSARSANEAIVTAATRPVARISSVKPDISPAFATIVDRALEFERSARWSNARAMQAELLAIDTTGAATRCQPPSEPLSSRAEPRAPSGLRGSRRLLGVISVGGALVLGLVMWTRHQAARTTPAASAATLEPIEGPRVGTVAVPVSQTHAISPRPLVDAGAVVSRRELPRSSSTRHPPRPPASTGNPTSAESALDRILDRRK